MRGEATPRTAHKEAFVTLLALGTAPISLSTSVTLLRAAVLADADALLACYSMGENWGADAAGGGGGAAGSQQQQPDGSGRFLLSGPSGLCVETGPPHVVVELAFTSSVRFLQPGLLLKVWPRLCSRPACSLQQGWRTTRQELCKADYLYPALLQFHLLAITPLSPSCSVTLSMDSE